LQARALHPGSLYWFFQDLGGITDLTTANIAWFATGTGDLSGHEKPSSYWLLLMARYEWLLLFLAAILAFNQS
jgi:hypothetical protein